MYLVGIMSMLILVTFSIIYNYDCFVPPVLAQQETAPVANAGADQIVHANDIITLNGSKSFDPDGDTIINYHWEGPPFSMLFVTPGSPAYFAIAIITAPLHERSNRVRISWC